MIDLERAQQLIMDSTPVLGRESVPILDALNRVLVEDVLAVEDLPMSDISAMDGYAVRHASLREIAARGRVRLRIIGESPAGKPCRAIVRKGDAVRIMTGGLVPEGADTVVKLEDACEDKGCVVLRKDPGTGAGIRFKGEAFKEGDIVLHSGEVVRPLVIGALASLRRAYVYVHRKPIVAVLSTGDELSDFHEPPSPSKAMCSNLYTLSALLKEIGATPVCLGTVPDDIEALKSILDNALYADVIITSGGTSKGKYDLIHQVFSRLKMETRFTNIFAKPGKPTIFGLIQNKMIFGLPGNPSATVLSFEQFIKPAILKMTGWNSHTRPSRKPDGSFARIDSFNRKLGGNRNHVRGPQVPLERFIPSLKVSPSDVPGVGGRFQGCCTENGPDRDWAPFFSGDA